MNRDDAREHYVCRAWPAEAAVLSAIRRQVGGWLESLALAEDAREDLVYAASEAATNAIEHAYPAPAPDQVVELSMWTANGTLFLQVVDHGSWRVPEPRRTARGRGLRMMRRLADGLQVKADDRGTRVVLSHTLTPAATGRA